MSLDTRQHRETPEGVTLVFPVAGPPVRLMAWLIDVGFSSLIYLAGLFFTTFGELGYGLLLIWIFLTTWFYHFGFEVWRDGSTPGKKMMDLQVIHHDGTPVGATASMLRNLLRTADFLPAAFGAGLLSMLIDRDFRRLGDLAAGTLVVYRERALALEEIPPATAVAPPVVLTRRERRAVVGFASRVRRWNVQRARELASVARPLTGQGGAKGLERLVGMAHWILGRDGGTP